MKLMVKIILAVSCLSLGMTAVASEQGDGIAVVVNKKVITRSRVREAERQFTAQGRFLLDENEEQRQEKVINFLIEEELVRQRAEVLGILVTSEEFDAAVEDIKQRNSLISDDQLKNVVNQEGKTWDEFTEEIKGQIKIVKLMSREVRSSIEVGDAEIREYYESHQDQFKPAAVSVHVRQILLEVKPGDDERAVKKRGETLVSDLRNGADFQALARAHSAHSSADSGGELGTFKEGELAAPYSVVFSMEAGAISDLLRTDAGFLILYVEERSGGAESGFESAKAQIQKILYKQKSEARYKAWLQELRQKAYIDIKQGD
ncbi:hypothetical protein CSB45_13640 [candidate division KSB3 bacterium]|uniref:PpiC domain-containing protein n=1 Tax=candidate division KSB3 bacterium TaxID=2044937 RepID=A0A2G6E2L0_9BACT|nr:MAG: hypothetical protein CSB45_13640 [candidate division KSB3 bacterium]PIE28602.1 MAG: hypothetical protein CSA57_13290 [candidate division KSB3 bacterium]